MQKRRILINAMMSVLQFLVLGAVFFVLYRFLLRTIGAEQFGIWSIVLATASVTHLANFGLSSSVVKFVAKYISRGEKETVSDLIQTAAISVCLLVGIMLLVGYLFASWILRVIIPEHNLQMALSLLPFALLSLWLSVLTGVFQAGLDGHQRIDIRCSLLVSASIFHLVLCFLVVPRLGLMGLAYAQVLQTSSLLLASWLSLKYILRTLPVVPYRWRRDLFREMVGYGVNFQVGALMSMLGEPTTKALLTKFGGLSMVAYYEMASRMVAQVRGLVVSANQVLVPALADLQERDPKSVQTLYKDSYQLIVYIAIPLFSALIALTPVISRFWIGHYENIFVLFSCVISLAMVINTLTAPAYFVNLGTDGIRWNTISHVTTGSLNFGLGLLFGALLGGSAVVFASAFSIIVGSAVTVLSYHLRHRIRLLDLVPKQSVSLIVFCALGSLLALLLSLRLRYSLNPGILALLVFLPFLATMGFLAWINPMREILVGWFTRYLWLTEKTGRLQ